MGEKTHYPYHDAGTPGEWMIRLICKGYVLSNPTTSSVERSVVDSSDRCDRRGGVFQLSVAAAGFIRDSIDIESNDNWNAK